MRMMFIAISLLAFVASCGPDRAPSSSATKDQFSGGSFLYLNAADRQQILADLRDMTVDNYVLLSIKAANAVVPDAKKLFDDAIAGEAKIADVADTDAVAQAKSNMAFLDRIQATIAAFQDTHFSSSAIVAGPTILNGLALARVGKDVRIVGRRKAVLVYAAEHAANSWDYQQIANGQRVVSIDGIPVEDAVKALLPFQSSSTRSYADASAVAALAKRKTALPEKSYADYEIEPKEGGATFKVRLPYYYSATKRADALYYLKARGFQPLSDLMLVYNDDVNSWAASRSLPTDGYYRWDAPAGLIGGTTWYSAEEDDIGYEAMRTGYVLKGGKSYGVLQLFEFSSANVTLEDKAPKTKVPYATPVQAFIRELAASGTPLILDLRDNIGGDPMNGVSVLAAIARPGEVYPTTTRALRVTRVIRQMLETGALDQLPHLGAYNYDETALAELRKAVAARREFTAAFALAPDVKSDVMVGGYTQKVVALISPACISACDGMGLLLRASKRATMIGTTTNGTGAGFIGDKPFDEIQYRDRDQFASLRIPNRLFGAAGAVGVPVQPDLNAYSTMNSENRPTAADVTYDQTLDDLLGRGAGWMAKAIEVIEAK